MKYPIHKHKRTIENAANQEVATRSQATLVSSVLGALPNPDPVLRKLGKREEVYRNLMADWEVFAATDLVHGRLQDLSWELEQGDADQKAFDEFEERFNAWDIRQVLSECVDGRGFGYQPFEFKWEKTDDAWQISRVIGKPPEWFNFSTDNQLQFKSRSNRLGEPVEPYQFACAQHRASYNNPYGEAVLSRCFWPTAFKRGGMEFWTKFLEKYSIPWVVGKQPRGTGETETDKLLEQLSHMVQDAVAVIPDDSSVEIQEASGKAASTDAFTSYAWYFDAAINKVILSSETTMSVSKEGSDVRGNASAQKEVSQSVINAIGGMAKDVVNQAIRWEWHFNHESPPPTFNVFEPKQIQKDRSERDNNLKQQGVQFNKNYYVNNYGLAEDEFEIEDPEESEPGFSQHGHGCQCPGCNTSTSVSRLPSAVSGFATEEERRQASQNQQTLEEMIEGYGGDEAAAANQAIMETVLQPVVDMISNADSMEEVMQKMAAQFPDMDTKQLEARVESALFLADTWGRLTAQEEDEDDK